MKTEEVEISIHINERFKKIDKKRLPEIKKKFSEFFIALGHNDVEDVGHYQIIATGKGWTAVSDKKEVFGIQQNDAEYNARYASRIEINERHKECILEDDEKIKEKNDVK